MQHEARTEAWQHARANLLWAWASMIFYCVVISILLFILARQCLSVTRAAGFWQAAQATPQTQAPALPPGSPPALEAPSPAPVHSPSPK